jgi:hypothetical protein
MTTTTSLIELIHELDNFITSNRESIEIISGSGEDSEIVQEVLDELPEKDTLSQLADSSLAIVSVLPLIKMVEDFLSNQITESIFASRYISYINDLDMKLEDSACEQIGPEVHNFLSKF